MTHSEAPWGKLLTAHFLATMHPLFLRIRHVISIPFVRNYAKFQTGTLLMNITGFVSSIVYARILGIEQYGLLAVISAFVGVLSVVAVLGQETALTTFLSEAIGEKNEQKINAVLRYFFQSSFLTILIYGVLFWLAPIFAGLMHNNEGIAFFARALLFNAMLQQAPTLAFIVLQIDNRIGLVTILENVRAIALLALAAFLLLHGYGIWGIIIATVSISLLYVPLSMWLYHRYAPELHLPSLTRIAKGITQRGTRIFFIEGLWIGFSSNIGKRLNPNIFFILLNATASLEVVGLFQIAFRIVRLPTQLIMPSITRLAAISIPRIVGSDRKALRASCLKLIAGTLGLITCAIIGLGVLTPFLLPIVYGQEFAGALLPFYLMLPLNIFSCVMVAAIPLVRVFRKTWVLLIVTSLGIAEAVLLFWILHLFVLPLYAISLSIVYFYAHGMLLYVYLWYIIRKQKRLSV